MRYLLTIDVKDDLIVVCRLLNVLRRKGVRLETLTMALTGEGYGLTALLNTPDAELDHLYHFLRRTEGVEHVAYYRPSSEGGEESSKEPASFVLVEGDADAQRRIQAELPGAQVVFAGHGRTLLEAGHTAAGLARLPGVHSFARVRTTREKVM